jgi:mono/diheme cytochrome c family protein
MMIRWSKSLVLAVLTALIMAGCSESEQTRSGKSDIPSHNASLIEDVGQGVVIFSARCASCHGKSGRGTDQGPPLIHRIYEPGHHSDYSIVRAVNMGVRSHHWGFGDMPPIPGLSPEDIKHVIAYIRQEQIRAGI